MNSLYGAWGNRFFRYYVKEIAEGITLTGQLAIKTSVTGMNGYLNKLMKFKNYDFVIAGDTDSIHVCLKPLVDKIYGDNVPDHHKVTDFLGSICRDKLNGILADGFVWMAEVTNAFENKMKMKLEKICPRSVYKKKKHYALAVLESEGVRYDEPHVYISGMAAVRSSTPEVCRKALKDAFKIVLLGKEEELHKFVGKFRQEFYKLPPEEIGKTSGTDDIDVYADKQSIYKKATPAHVKGCLIHNAMLVERDMQAQYEMIVSGDKIKFVYLKKPNPSREQVISFKGVLPRELGLHKYVDYPTQFDKVFGKPLSDVTDLIGWSMEERATLDAFFG